MIHIRASFLRHARHPGKNARRGFNLSPLHVLRNCATSSINCRSPSPSPPPAALAYTHVHASWPRKLATSHSENTRSNVEVRGIGQRFNCYRAGCKVSCCPAGSNQRYKGAKVILFDSRIPPGHGKKHAFSCAAGISRVKPVFLITTRCYALNESPFFPGVAGCCVLTVVRAVARCTHAERLTSVLRAIIGPIPFPRVIRCRSAD